MDDTTNNSFCLEPKEHLDDVINNNDDDDIEKVIIRRTRRLAYLQVLDGHDEKDNDESSTGSKQYLEEDDLQCDIEYEEDPMGDNSCNEEESTENSWAAEEQHVLRGVRNGVLFEIMFQSCGWVVGTISVCIVTTCSFTFNMIKRAIQGSSNDEVDSADITTDGVDVLQEASREFSRSSVIDDKGLAHLGELLVEEMAMEASQSAATAMASGSASTTTAAAGAATSSTALAAASTVSTASASAQVGMAVGVAVAATAVAAGAGTIITAYNTTVTTTQTSVQYPWIQPNCSGSHTDQSTTSNPFEVKQGYVDLVLRGITPEILFDEKERLEELFVEAYNNVSGRCEGIYERIVYNVSLLPHYYMMADNQNNTLAYTQWVALLSCNGCPDDEPLFSLRPEDHKEGTTMGMIHHASGSTAGANSSAFGHIQALDGGNETTSAMPWLLEQVTVAETFNYTVTINATNTTTAMGPPRNTTAFDPNNFTSDETASMVSRSGGTDRLLTDVNCTQGTNAFVTAPADKLNDTLSSDFHDNSHKLFQLFVEGFLDALTDQYTHKLPTNITLAHGATVHLSSSSSLSVTNDIVGGEEEVVQSFQGTEDGTIEEDRFIDPVPNVEVPSIAPSGVPSDEPSLVPTAKPTEEPTLTPTKSPEAEPTLGTTEVPGDKVSAATSITSSAQSQVIASYTGFSVGGTPPHPTNGPSPSVAQSINPAKLPTHKLAPAASTYAQHLARRPTSVPTQTNFPATTGPKVTPGSTSATPTKVSPMTGTLITPGQTASAGSPLATLTTAGPTMPLGSPSVTVTTASPNHGGTTTSLPAANPGIPSGVRNQTVPMYIAGNVSATTTSGPTIHPGIPPGVPDKTGPVFIAGNVSATTTTSGPTVNPGIPSGKPNQSGPSFIAGNTSTIPTSAPGNNDEEKDDDKDTQSPSSNPSGLPSKLPSSRPSHFPTHINEPSWDPSMLPSLTPSSMPTNTPSPDESSYPSEGPTDSFSSFPSQPYPGGINKPPPHPIPKMTPKPATPPSPSTSQNPTHNPTRRPTRDPTVRPTRSPTRRPTNDPSPSPTKRPTEDPTLQPTSAPTTDTPTSFDCRENFVPVESSYFLSIAGADAPTVSNDQLTSTFQFSYSLMHELEGTQCPPVISTMAVIERYSVPPQQHLRERDLQATRRMVVAFSIQSDQPPTMESLLSSTQEERNFLTLFNRNIIGFVVATGFSSNRVTSAPTGMPSASPSVVPSVKPSATPTILPSTSPSLHPSTIPSISHSDIPSLIPSISPTGLPSANPSGNPALHPARASLLVLLPAPIPRLYPALVQVCPPVHRPV